MREAKSTDQEEVEELSFVPSAISVPQKLMCEPTPALLACVCPFLCCYPNSVESLDNISFSNFRSSWSIWRR